MSRGNSGKAGEDKGSSGFVKVIAAGFLVAVVVVAAALFIVNRKSGDGDAGGGAAAGGSSWNAGGEAMDSRSVADRFDWADRKADINGQMVYKPEPRVGKILSETTRSYPSPTGVEASTARPEGVVFESIDMIKIWGIPFSMSDGPTGFDGNVPVGYTRSAAGAALAAAAYNAGTVNYLPSPEKYKTIFANPTSGQLDFARREEQVQLASLEALGESATDAFGEAIMNAPDGYTIDAYDGNYARISIYDRAPNPDTGRQVINASLSDLIWTEHGWKLKAVADKTVELDSFPEGLISWTH
ncbi:hypothetical protein [Corynebacterium bovis]|uniref:hypothetical protein n=1 Tax=Corynebacterium bovis TaxID=36808 RepID=UPI0031387095